MCNLLAHELSVRDQQWRIYEQLKQCDCHRLSVRLPKCDIITNESQGSCMTLGLGQCKTMINATGCHSSMYAHCIFSPMEWELGQVNSAALVKGVFSTPYGGMSRSENRQTSVETLQKSKLNPPLELLSARGTNLYLIQWQVWKYQGGVLVGDRCMFV